MLVLCVYFNICRLKVDVRQNDEIQWKKEEEKKKKRLKSQEVRWEVKARIISPHFQKQLPPLPAFSPPLT